MIANRKQ